MLVLPRVPLQRTLYRRDTFNSSLSCGRFGFLTLETSSQAGGDRVHDRESLFTLFEQSN